MKAKVEIVQIPLTVKTNIFSTKQAIVLQKPIKKLFRGVGSSIIIKRANVYCIETRLKIENEGIRHFIN